MFLYQTILSSTVLLSDIITCSRQLYRCFGIFLFCGLKSFILFAQITVKWTFVLYFTETRAIIVTVIKVYTDHSAFCSSVKTDMGAAGAISRLYIANANKKDSGNYSCALANVAAATMVSVHVLNGMFSSRTRILSYFDTLSIMCEQKVTLFSRNLFISQTPKIDKSY